ncbi:MMPL family transporter [Streptomyces albireticuli]|uniref:MMPL family transporter n=1 Tax=Streptomyces albireticuli TaxID=1940 RepID=UPI0036AB0942
MTSRPPPPSNAAPHGSSGPPAGWLGRTGHWCARHFLVVIALWLVCLGGTHALERTFGGEYSDDFTLPATQSQDGADVLKAHDPAAGGFSGQVVLHDGSAPLTRFGDQVSRAVADLRKLPHVLSVQNPLPPPGAATGQRPSDGRNTGPLSGDGKTAYLTVRLDTPPSALGASYLDGVDRAVRPLREAGIQVEYGGPLGELARPQPNDRTSEIIGFAVAIVVLLIGFGSVLAAGLPLVTALAGVVIGLSALALLAAAFTFATVSPTLATMIGLGVGIDYALFLLTRHRQHVMDGMDPARSAGLAMATSGRAVLVSGCTVIVALMGLWVSGVSFIGKLGVAAAVTVVSAVLGALTLVPALLGLVGTRVDRLRVRTPVAEGSPDGRREGGPEGGPAGKTEAGGPAAPGPWHRYARRVERGPWWFLAAGVLAIAVLSVPLLFIRLGHIGDGADPESFTDRRAYDLTSRAFGPGANGPLTLVIDQSRVPAADRPALAGTAAEALADPPGTASVTPLRPTPDGDVLVATAFSATAPQDAATTDLVNRLKNDTLPKAVSGTAARGYVTGTTATQADFVDMLAARLPLIIAAVVALAFLLILVVFHGILVALKAAALNLLSIAASYGVVVAVFQWGWGGPALGVSGTVPIESYVPMMMFAIVFGLSMDYEIFLLSRIHEAWLRTGDAKDSVAHALEITARVITCAALIMVSVFAAFIVSENIVVKMLAVGLAVSVLIDATVVRLLLVPAVMTLLGRSAWWTPPWLERVLPRVDAEGTDAEP